VLPQTSGIWAIERMVFTKPHEQRLIGWPSYTRLVHGCGDVVMEDSWTELRKHLPIWLAASGRVLVTGLGLGCVVRGLLAKPDVTHIDVIEIDRHILRVIGDQFASEPRVTFHHADALRFPVPHRYTWDFGWHDIWDEEHLHVLHAKLLKRFHRACGRQGAWQFPRCFKRTSPLRLLGGPRRRHAYRQED
jgi:hypothetical protein